MLLSHTAADATAHRPRPCDLAPIDRVSPPPPAPDAAWRVCAQVQASAAEHIDASLSSLLHGLMAVCGAVGARWRLEDTSRAGPPCVVAGCEVGAPWRGHVGLSGGHPLSLRKAVRPGRGMVFEFDFLADHAPTTEAQDTLRLILDSLGRWLHWLDMSHGPVTAQGAMPQHQRKVLLLMVTGLSEKQIADRLGISNNTAHQYVTSLFRRYGVRNRPSLMARWLGDLAQLPAAEVRQGRVC